MTAEEKRERNRLYNIAWREKNREKVRKSQQLFDEKHPERRKEIMKKFRETHKKKRYTENKEYRQTKKGRACLLCVNYKQYDKIAKRKGFSLTQKWVIDNIFNSQCIYCGDNDWRHLGCDRINNGLPHTPENCVCSCGICNVERNGKNMSIEEFIEFRKTNPRILKQPKLEEIVEINGTKVIKKAPLM